MTEHIEILKLTFSSANFEGLFQILSDWSVIFRVSLISLNVVDAWVITSTPTGAIFGVSLASNRSCYAIRS